MTSNVRPFEPADVGPARALWQATPGVGLSAADGPDAILRFLRHNPGLSLVAHDESAHLLGTILVGHDGRRALIHHLVTAPAARRRGIGTELLRQGLRGLHAAGIDKCHLLVFGDNADGLAFWRAVGARERVELRLLSIDAAPQSP